MRSVQRDLAIGLVAQLVLLVLLAGTVGLNGAGWVVGVACAVITNAALTGGLRQYGAGRLGPADRVTLVRAGLVGGVAALTADSFGGSAALTALVGLAVVALLLDAVDGWVARRTETASPLGSRFDMEVDAFLILVLSVYGAHQIGPWVLAIGAARYVFVVAGWLLPWLRGSVPPLYWRKAVAASQGVVLTFAAADVLPYWLTVAALAACLALLASSFGSEAWLLWRQRNTATDSIETRPTADRQGLRIAVGRVLTVLAGLLVWFALVAPDQLHNLSAITFVRIPVEGLLLVALVLVLPPRTRGIAALFLGALLGVLTIVKLLDMGFFEALGRPFDPMLDWSYFGSAVGLLSDSVGHRTAMASVAAAGVLCVALLIFLPLSVLRLSRLLARHRTASFRTISALGVAWILCAVTGLQVVSGAPVASKSAASLAYHQVSQVHTDLKTNAQFADVTAGDAFRNTPGNDLLTGLRGKDVVIAFVESYGKVAVQGSAFSPKVDDVLDTGTRQLQAAGFSTKSAFLTSPTFGGISWLAHSTLQTGLWVNNQQRYNTVVASDRFTLSDAFKRAGWRTVVDVPSNTHPWPEATSFYHYDQTYNASNVGYAGPRFSYAEMPDQYTLSAFQRNELAKTNRPPVMAEIDLVSSHTPWALLPHMIDWSQVGDGSVFDGMPEQGNPRSVVWRSAKRVRAAYGQSIRYSMSSLISFVQTYHDNNLVLVVLGDHQPSTTVSGYGATHDVPISIIAHDPKVMDSISSWGWQNGLRPHPNAPVWPMDSFRDRFLTAYGPQPAGSQAQH